MQQFVSRIRTDLLGTLTDVTLNTQMFTQDNMANRIVVELYEGQEQSVIAQTVNVVGIVIRNDGYTLEFTGGVDEDGFPYVELPRAAYDVVGNISILIRLVDDGKKTIIAVCNAYVRASITDSIIDPDDVIPSLDELLAMLDDMDQAVTDCNTATANAIQAVSDAEDVIDEAEDAIAEAEAAADALENMTVSAQNVSPSTGATATITVVDGHYHIAFGISKGDPGKDFRIRKVFTSIAQMEAYTGTDVEIGDFVIINTGNVEDPDNAKMFVLTDDQQDRWSFVTDLSGSAGIQGPTGPQGIQGIQGLKGDKTEISSQQTLYQNSTSGTVAPTGTWETTQPYTPQGQYLWVRRIISWDSGSSTTIDMPCRMGIDGDGRAVTEHYDAITETLTLEIPSYSNV